jgi:hypothetical protein
MRLQSRNILIIVTAEKHQVLGSDLNKIFYHFRAEKRLFLREWSQQFTHLLDSPICKFCAKKTDQNGHQKATTGDEWMNKIQHLMVKKHIIRSEFCTS